MKMNFYTLWARQKKKKKKRKEGRLDKVPHVNIMQLLGLASCFREHKSQLNVISSSYKK